MNLKHRILQSLYTSKYLGKDFYDNNLMFVAKEVKMDDLVKHIHIKPEKIYDMVMSLHFDKDLNYNELTDIITITEQGFKKLSNKTYIKEKQKRIRDNVLFFSKVLGIIATILGIIMGVNKLINILDHNRLDLPPQKVENANTK